MSGESAYQGGAIEGGRSANAQTSPPPLTWPAMLLYGLGSSSNGIKNRSISTFLLIFYSQVIGIPATWVGSAMAITLIIDGVLDPVIGQISDNFRSRWGRRHPFMYASVIPYGFLFYLLWSPPVGWSDSATLAYMTCCIVAVRFVDTFFEVPASALTAELSSDYHQRTTLVACRYFFTFLGGLGMIWVAYRYFMSDERGGLFVRENFQNYGLLASLVISVSILVAAISTHNRIPWLHKAPTRKLNLATLFHELRDTLANKSLWLANGAGLFVAIATGMVGGLATYFQVYFWELTPTQLSYLPVAGMAAAGIGIIGGPFLTRWFGKRQAAIGMFAALIAVSIAAVSLRLANLLPPNGSTTVFVIQLLETVAVQSLTLMSTVAITSMIMDVAEDSELKTGRRSEGLLVSVDNVLKKTTAGAGVFFASVVLTFAGLSDRIRPGEVAADSLWNLGAVFVPAICLIYGGAIAMLLIFKLDEAAHSANLAELEKRRAAKAVLNAFGD